MIKRVLCFETPAYLNLKLAQLIVTYPDIEKDENLTEEQKKASRKSVPIEDVGVVILDNKQITITQALMSHLLDNNVAIITCNDQHMPIGLQLPLEGHTLQSERFRSQIEASEPLRKQM